MLSTQDDLSLDMRRQAMKSFEFGFGVACSSYQVFGENKNLNYLPISMIYPEHNDWAHPILITDQLRIGANVDELKKEDLLRRVYQLGRTSLAVRCIPDFENQLDELEFVFRGENNRDLKKSIRAIENLVIHTGSAKDKQTYEWGEQ